MSAVNIRTTIESLTAPLPCPAGGDRPALFAPDGQWSRAELEASILAARTTLERLGLRPGHRVAVILPTGAPMLTAFLAALRLGLTVTPLSPALGPAMRNIRLREFDPDLVIDRPLDELRAPPSLKAPTTNTSRVVLWTSGSTGVPTGNVFTIDALLWNAATNARHLGLRADDRTLVLLDGAFSYSLVHQISAISSSELRSPFPSSLPGSRRSAATSPAGR